MNQKDIILAAIFSLFAVMIVVGFVYLQKGHESDGLIVSSPSELIVGDWQSKDDEKSVVTYRDDGTTEDVYDGELLSTGAWEISQAEQPSLRVTMDGEEYKYTVIEISNEELGLIYMARGNILRYTKINDVLDTQ